MTKRSLLWVAIASAGLSAGWAQEQPVYVQQFCVKAVAGKSSAVDARMPDVAKYMRVRVDEGGLAFWVAFKAVIPAGTSARCDYLLNYAYSGFPAGPLTPEQAEATYHKAGLAGSYSQMLIERDATSTLVSNDLFRSVTGALVGPGSEKGSYVRLNLFKVKPGHSLAEWAKLEIEGWKPFAEAMAKETPGFGWRAEQLVMPTGSSLHYNAMTVDIYPTWEASGKGASAQLWSAVHPDLSPNDYLAKVNDVVDRYKAELYRAVEVVRKK
jgi:hypothetical protein